MVVVADKSSDSAFQAMNPGGYCCKLVKVATAVTRHAFIASASFPPPLHVQLMTDSSFFVKAAEVLSKCHKKREDLAALLHPEEGFAPSLSKICKSRLVFGVSTVW